MKTIFTRLLTALGLTIGLLGLFPASPVSAATLTVNNCNDSGEGSLRNAVATMNSGDIVNFNVNCPGSNPITLESTIFLPRYGVDNITISGAGHTIHMNGVNVNQIFFINYNRTVRLEYLTLMNASNENAYDGKGGAILDNGSDLTLDHLIFYNNRTNGDQIEHFGGAIYHESNGSLTISNSTFTNNSAKGFGGAIFTRTYATITDSTFRGNSANFGGGLAMTLIGKTISLERVTMNNNIAVGPVSGDEPIPGEGGALYVLGNSLIISNSTLSGNGSADYTTYGGAIFYDGGGKSVTIKNSTIVNNLIDSSDPVFKGGGLYINNASINYYNTILANNAVDDCATGGGLTVANNIKNLAEISHGCGTPAVSSDPKLGPLTNNGGSTYTHALLSGSPAIDTGNDANCLATDQRGVLRPYGVHCDIGAYERAGFNVYLPMVVR